MEINLKSELNSEKSDIFQLDFESQSYKNNPEFKKFQNSIFKKYGTKLKLFKCNNDKILFYYDCSQFPFYEAKCPKCFKSICYFCSCLNNYPQQNCCLKKKAYYLFKVNGFLYFNSYPGYLEHEEKFKDSLLFAIIPFVNLLYFIGCLHAILFYRMRRRNKETYYYVDYESCMTSTDKNRFYIITFFLFEVSCSIFIAITLFVFNFYFTILIIIISIPFKFYPIKYLFGIHHSVYYINY